MQLNGLDLVAKLAAWLLQTTAVETECRSIECLYNVKALPPST